MTKNEKEVIDKLRALRTDPHSARRMDLSFCRKESSQEQLRFHES
jgi:hypothetical protein